MDGRPPKRSIRKVDEAHEALIDRALALYQPRTTRRMDREDGRESIHNLSGYLGVLLEWKHKEIAAKSAVEPE